jgi:hypothetical protein
MGEFGGRWIPLTTESDENGELDFLAPKGMENAHMELDLSGYGKTVMRYRIGNGPIQSNRSLKLGTLTQDRDDITLIHYPAPLLFVHVRAADGSIPPDISATATYKSGIATQDLNGYAFWNYDPTPGRWTFDRLLPDEEATLTLSAPHYQSATQLITMKEGEHRDITVTLQPAAH